MVSGTTDPCVHCGFCLPTCASYRVLGTEMDSPRGRIHALKAIERGELELDATTAKHFDTCLGCFACVSACPSGVRYDELIEAMRPQLNAAELRTPMQQAFRTLLFNLLPYPKRLRQVLRLLRPYSGSGLQRWLRRSQLLRLLGPQLEAMERLLPALPPEGFNADWPLVMPAIGPKRGRVGLVLGCVQQVFDPEVNAATVRVLTRNGFEVVIPPNQGCCGAATHHQGELEQTRSHARALIRAFDAVNKGPEDEPYQAILVAASGCGHTLKHYDTILGEEGAPFSAQVQDVHEFLSAAGLAETFAAALHPLQHPSGETASAENPLAVAVHDACHMLHGQGISAEPRQLLLAIPHVQLKNPADLGVCCGSAGIYNLVQPQEAAALGAMKAEDLRQTGAEIAASANIGCSLQLRRHAPDLEVLHPMQLLDRSFREAG